MATIESLIDELIIVTVGDPSNERQLDAAYLVFIKNAYRYINNLIPIHGLTFGQKRGTITSVEDVTTYPLGSSGDNALSFTDFNGAIGLWRDDNDTEVCGPVTIDQWQTQTNAGHLWGWRIDENGANLWVKDMDEAETLYLWYYSKVDVTTLETSTTTPWNGATDDFVIDTVAMRVNSLEEMVALPQDVKFWGDFRRGLIARYGQPSPHGDFVSSAYRVGRYA